MRKWLYRLGWAGGGLTLLMALAAVLGWLALRASLPRTSGVVTVAGLSAPVEISRDALGVPTVRGGSFEDVALGQGFLHAQDRFFQMDISRRLAAGELSALLGELAVGVDERMRRYRYRHVAEAVLAGLPPRHRRALESYTAGVNAGLADLAARPPEYFLLRVRPEPWTPEDCVLLLHFFFEGLSLNDVLEKPAGVMQATLPPALYEFLTPDASRFDAPLITHASPEEVVAPLAVPGPEVVDLRSAEPVTPDRDVVRPLGMAVAGSNSWAVAGSRTSHGGAMLANDPHLALGVPNVWYRATLEWGDNIVQGVGPPGVPSIIIGASHDLAWGVTNSIADQLDLVVIETIPSSPGHYLTPDGPRFFEKIVERIAIKGGEPRRFEILTTRWGPVVDHDWRGRPLALRSRALSSDGADFGLFDLVTARTIEDGIEILRRWKGPSLNWVLADGTGRIGWIVGGQLPSRVGFDGKTPVSWADGTRRWEGSLDETQRPVVVDPPQGVLYTANNRTVPLDRSRQLGRVWVMPVRARRIAERLGDGDGFSETDLLDIQLDTTSLVHGLARDLVLEVTTPDETDPGLAAARALAESWNGTADADERGFRLLHHYYDRLQERLLVGLLTPALEADEAFVYNWPLADEPLRRILETRPAHLLPGGHDDWPAALRAVLVETIAELEAEPPGLDAPWGAVNRASIRHPVAMAVPWLGRMLNMPRDALPGWRASVRVQTPRYGATLRMVVSPGRDETALFHMPTGQSGHFLSPHYDDGHHAWVEGLATPLAAGPAVSTLTLQP